MLLVTGAAMSFFMFKTVATTLILAHKTGAAAAPADGTRTKEYFVVAIAALQLPVSWLMGI
jgi:hypothetical protein